MASSRMSGAAITGWGTAVPDAVVTNHDLERRVRTSDQWIVERTGIRERRVASASETTASLGALAASRALHCASVAPDEVDLMIVATATPEQPIPHTGAFIGEALGVQCGSFDLNAACAGFVYGLVVGTSITTTSGSTVLLVGAETLSRIIDPEDRATCVLFGDGAGAAVITPSATPRVVAWDLGCDGSAAGILQIPAGGSRRPSSASTVAAREHYLQMSGQEVFRRAVRAVVDSAQATLARAGVAPSDVDWFVPHQANARIIETAGARLGFTAEQTIVNIDRFGNTSSASIPLALFEAVDAGRVRPGDRVLVAGFGAGMTWASALVEWSAP